MNHDYYPRCQRNKLACPYSLQRILRCLCFILAIALFVVTAPVFAQNSVSPSITIPGYVSQTEALQHFEQLKRDLPWDFREGCSARAFACWEYFESKGIAARPVFVRAAAKNQLIFGASRWSYHVACWIFVEGEPKIFDPGTVGHPANFVEWYQSFRPAEGPFTPVPKPRSALGPGRTHLGEPPGQPGEGEPPWVVVPEHGWDTFLEPAPTTPEEEEELEEQNRKYAYEDLENIRNWYLFLELITLDLFR